MSLVRNGTKKRAIINRSCQVLSGFFFASAAGMIIIINNQIQEWGMNMTTVKIKGMRCQHCVGSARKALEELEGVSDVQVDLDKGEASFEGNVPLEKVRKAIAGIGFEVVE